MKPAYFTLLLLFTVFSLQLKAQSDSAAQAQSFAHHDSVYAAKLIIPVTMIGGGVGLVGVGSFLITKGIKFITPM